MHAKKMTLSIVLLRPESFQLSAPAAFAARPRRWRGRSYNWVQHTVTYFALPVIFVLGFVVFAYSLGANAAAAENSARVIVVHSYDAGYIWTQRINEGIKEGLNGNGVIEKTYYMDAKKQTTAEKQKLIASMIATEINTSKPAILIAVDDPAQQYLVVPYLKEQNDIQIVFCGVNAPLEKYDYPTNTISGVRERWHYREGFSLAKKIAPWATKIAFLIEDSESGEYVIQSLKKDMKTHGDYALELIGIEKIKTWREWRERITYYQNNTDFLALGLYNAISDENTGNTINPDKVMEWTNSVNKKPTLGFSDIAKMHGIVCGILESGHEQGYLAGNMAKEIISKKKNAGEFPVIINNKGLVFLNLKAAEKSNIKIPYSIIETASEIIK